MNKICILTIIFSIFATSCYFSRGLSAGDKAVAEFHKKFNNKEFDEIYDQSGVEFKGVQDKQKVVETWERIRETLGKVEDTSRGGWTVSKNSMGLIATVNFETTYQKGIGKERFVFFVIDDEVKLTEYEFSSENIE